MMTQVFLNSNYSFIRKRCEERQHYNSSLGEQHTSNFQSSTPVLPSTAVRCYSARDLQHAHLLATLGIYYATTDFQ
jgi:hypothetical protein